LLTRAGFVNGDVRGHLITVRWLPLPAVDLPHALALTRLVHPVLVACGWTSVVLILSNRVRTGAAISASLLLGAYALDYSVYANGGLFVTVLMLLVAVGVSSVGRFQILRLQLGLLYFGAFLNKLCDPDWRSGRFMTEYLWILSKEPEVIGRFNGVRDVLLPALSRVLPLGSLLSWGTIFSEAFLALAFLSPRTTALGVLWGIAFHTGITLVHGSTMSSFYLSLTGAYLAVWLEPGSVKDAAVPGSAGVGWLMVGLLSLQLFEVVIFRGWISARLHPLIPLALCGGMALVARRRQRRGGVRRARFGG
jgi:hypothetical protein